MFGCPKLKTAALSSFCKPYCTVACIQQSARKLKFKNDQQKNTVLELLIESQSLHQKFVLNINPGVDQF